ncbi:pleckstrin homology domain-containing family G member 3 [Drosophila takahashii]|uniref:pleckstrin homology domain-containing family G member 3 n=1 Tax=Drosophila takahashii TaxID=29030 RepID=UPI0038990AEE
MDIESDSDTSERWEDFFGSTTELAPSLLGIYDTLAAAPTATSHESKASSSGDSTPKRSNSNCSSSSSTSSSTGSCSSVPTSDDQSASYTLAKSSSQLGGHQEHPAAPLVVAGLRDEPDGAQLSRLVVQRRSQQESQIHGSSSSLASSGGSSSRRGSNIRILSPNVHRIITHSDIQPVEAVSAEALKQHQQSQRSPTQGRYIKTGNSGAGSPAGGGSTPKHKLSHIPLSKITGKLSTQSGSELVSTFDSSNEYLHSVAFAAFEKTSSKAMDEDRTPTNHPGMPFHFEGNPFQKRKLTLPRYDSQQSIKLIEMEQLAATSAQLQHAQPATPGTPATPTPNTPTIPKPKEFVCSEPLSPVDIVDTINFDLVTQHIERLTLADPGGGGLDPRAEIIEAVNKTLVSKPLVRSSSAACASTICSSPLLTYARTKSLGAKASTLGGGVPLKLPTAEQLAELEEANKLSAESLDRLTDIKPKFAARLSELARLNNRPLSSSSICSTSSSSSSGSDQLLNGKLTATSYLASVESLAESENELGDPHHPPAMSVLEKTCLEIVDSERSFVEDLGQVIKGYLLDWKERACLRVDELQILFANIEEIYEFNSMLLQRLINTGRDPGRIARCFIDLREGFDVYTTYCTSYPEAISLLTKLLQATHTYSLLASTQKLLQHRLPLGSYLLKPVQRILKYHLLLDSLRKHCDVKEVAEAYVIMRQVAYNIDQVKRKQEQQSRVKELSGILDGWLGPELTVLGELRQEGLLMEQHNKQRLVLLFATMLIITKQKEDGRLQFKTYISQNNLMLSEHLPGEPTSFYVIPFDEPRHQIKLTARNRDQKRIWTQHIKGVMLEKLDIPMRAKELVYQLGNEEDRTPDRSTWKWSLHSGSNSTPTYLERRNACRRSEIRQRNSKFKRKTVANSSSFDSFNESLEQEEEPVGQVKPSKPLARNNSLDDTALQKLAAAMRYRKRDAGGKEEVKTPVKESCKCGQDAKQEDQQEACSCILRDQRSRSAKSHSPVFSYKALKERSKSVPRIGGFSLDEEAEREREQDEDSAASLRGSKPDLSERKTKGKGFFEVKQYNHKTMPKKIATLKKQRGSNTKSCSRFYMDLSEFDSSSATVLKITESTEELRPDGEIELAQEAATLDEGSPTDPQYYSPDQEPVDPLSPAEKSKRDAQIVLDLLKNNKEFERIYNKQQKRRESPVSPVSPDVSRGSILPPPRPPSRSPPPLELEVDQKKRVEEVVDSSGTREEPIYETLLRNVHVPYKFSPVLGRAKSSQMLKKRSKAAPAAPRPESDYVTLVYSPEGVLQRVGEEAVHRDSCSSSSSTSTSSNGSGSTLKRDSQSTVINLSMEAIQEHGSRPLPKNSVSGSESSLLPRALKSLDMAFGRSNRPPERRVSDVSEMCRQSVLHRQGSEAVGERMAHVDYADPKTLFGLNNSERDSVFSLTSSSSDSMCEQQRKRSGVDPPSASFEYEQQVEDSLENDFRDSAIYSDDNEKRSGDYDVHLRRPSSPPPPPPPLGPRPHHHHQPPQIAPKPSRDQLIQQRSGVIVCQSASRSWVLQQIENFNK